MQIYQRNLYPDLGAYIREVQGEFETIPRDRIAELAHLTRFINENRSVERSAKLVFICTHNSRRSHMAQIWAWTAAQVFGVDRIETYSGGTEATHLNPRAVAALMRAGFSIKASIAAENPIYSVRHGIKCEPLRCFSKVYNQPPNPKHGFCAVMTCSAADEACPVVRGASKRIAIRYEDPKKFDGSKVETGKYDERCRQIAREMFFVFKSID